MSPNSLTDSYAQPNVFRRRPTAATRSLRRRLPLLIFALLGMLGAAFAAMAYHEVESALRISGTERINAAAARVADLLGQSVAARLADANRLATDPQVRQMAWARERNVTDVAAPALQAFVSRNAQTAVWLYDDTGQVLAPLARGRQAPAETAAAAPLSPPVVGVSPLRSRDGHVWYHATVPMPPADGAAPPARLLSVQRALGSAQAAELIERLIGSGAALKLGNASGELWTDLTGPVPPPPTAAAGTSATYTSPAGEIRLGTAVPVPGTPWLLWTEMSEGSLLAPARTLLRRMLPITLAFTAFAALAVYAVSGRITSPLEQVAQAADAVAAGDYTQRIDLNRRDEVGRLAAAFNLMSARVAESHEELEARVQARTRELEHSREELDKYAADLEAANRELQSFSYSVSHDLRAPLRSIDGFSQALAEDYEARLDETGRDYLSRIRAAAQRMGVLIDDLLSLSKVTRVELMRTTVDLTALVHDAVTRLSEQDPQREVQWKIQSDVTVDGDPRLLRLALDNLLDNAWKFTSKREAAIIEFAAMTLPDGQRAFLVRDNGAGFDMEHAGKLFGAFQRLHGAAEFPGTGVGLATVQRVINRHGGRIWAEAAVDTGAAFFFTLEGS